jgi:predicted RND superfamily exporter protein
MRLVRFVSWLTARSLRRWRTFLAVATLLALGGAWLASRLTLRTSFEELLPEDVPSVRNAKELARRVGGDGTVLLMVEAERGPQDLPAAERLASKLAEGLRALGPELVRSVESELGPVKRWYADHWPLFLPLADLREARDELVEVLGKEKARLNPTLQLLDEEEAAESPGGSAARPLDLEAGRELRELLDPARPSPRQKVEQGFARYVDGYMVHPDRRSVTVIVRPTGTSLGVSEVRVVLDAMQAVVDRSRGEAEANHLKVGFGGAYPVLLSEYESILKGAALGFVVVLAVLLLSILAFLGEARLVLALGVALLVAVAVTFGLTWLAIGHLNMQTAFLGSIVAGNGINYGIIYLGRLRQLRQRGVTLEPACHEAARVTASGTLLAALGTSVAFGTLLIATNRGFRHFGIIGGMGMVLCWTATFALLPALLVLMERLRPSRPRIRPLRHERVVASLERLFRRPRAVVATFSILTAVGAVAFLRDLPDALERNLENLTNDETGSAELRRVNDRAQAGLGQSITGSVALLPSREGAEAYCAAIAERLREQPRLRQLINGCETIASVVPTHQAEKLALLRDIGERLTDRVLSQLTAAQAGRAREIRGELLAQHRLSDADAPPSLVDRFRERDGAVGRLAFVRSQPDAKLELAPNLREFAAAVRGVPVEGRLHDAAGADIVMSDLLADIERQGPRVTALSFLCVCLLVVVFFRTFGRSALLIASFTSGVILMAGVTALADLKINFFNFIAYPITFGLAVDYGANVFSRLRVRRNVVPALVEVAPSMLICSWTAIVGNASLVVSFNRALRSFGWYTIMGELATLTTATVFLPAMVKLLPVHLWHAPEGEALEEDEVLRRAERDHVPPPSSARRPIDRRSERRPF